MPDAAALAAPSAFLSHASEDKNGFVEPLGRRLAQLGVAPWLDKWEILPGDSLVRRLFDEGLDKADAVIVVVSRFSVGKPWVREELDSATVRRIQEGTRLIPVRLDEVDMPSPLKHLVWINSGRGAEEVEFVAQKIAATLHGHDPRPVVGPPPVYTMTEATVGGLTRADTFLLTVSLQQALESDQFLLDWHAVARRAAEGGLTSEALMESVHALADGDYVDARLRQDQVVMYSLTPFGYEISIQAVLPNLNEIHQRITAELVNNPPGSFSLTHDLAAQAEAPRLVVEQFLNHLQDRGLLSWQPTMGGGHLSRVSPTLRRELN
ncbi:toll/interleukin-1 receptor domain-containing protein [Streptomyces sp. DSM 40750]|uniref:toll/interleukin-1 receptor domain-containing protein n=1 Tax=Streptomyces sp. DSM 40750 TaxID=2801030 RepID=UPI00214C7C25|nr:toll/interleukin-1 receptor domain-containing protein [Streptomyces sp. DSM 40750]UUU24911.1 toll/interleukin-1 receptor domain-containing protein [Streptomyces sp. DSM 40750]